MTRETIGVLGGGQLARMLVESAARLGLPTRVLAGSPDDPAALVSPSAVLGTLSDPVAVRRFLLSVDVVTFENEFVDTKLLAGVAAEVRETNGHVVRFAPGLAAIETMQDKLRQKKLLEDLGIPTAPYLAFEGDRKGLPDWVSRANAEFDGHAVFKWARLGYDGKGTLIGPKPEKEILAFCEAALAKGVPVYAEKRIDFSRELAIVSCRSRAESKPYPLVVSEQRSGICRNVYGPATAFGVAPELEKRAQEHAARIADRLELVGVHAIEFFLAGEKGAGEKLWVNELAPRVHNSGHYSQDACACSQFENHMRAVAGAALGEVAPAPRFAMRNLIAPGDDPKWASPPVARAAGRLHWYGKTQARAGRKMGHLNFRAEDPAGFSRMISELDRIEREWEEKT